MKYPRPLVPGDAILLAAPARFVTESQVRQGVEWIESAGFRAIVPDGILEKWGQFGGGDAHRATILNEGIRRADIRAIWSMRGGYGCARLLPQLDEVAFQNDPTWLIGFSDVTALHAWSNRQGIASLHAAVVNTFGQGIETHRAVFWKQLIGAHDAPSNEAAVVGGNLSVLYSLLGTPFFPNCAGCWLLLEDLDEYLYHLDRMMLAFKLAGVLNEIHGVLCGSFSDMRDNTIADGQAVDNPFGKEVKDIILDHVGPDKPIVWNIPVGHGAANQPVVLGAPKPAEFA